VFCAYARCHAGHPPRCCRDEKAADGTKRGPARFRKYSTSRAQSPRSLKLIGRASDGYRVPGHVERAFVRRLCCRSATGNPPSTPRGEARAWPAFRADQLPRGREFGRLLFARVDGGAPAGPAGHRELGSVRASSAWPAESVLPAGLAGSPAATECWRRERRLPKVPDNDCQKFPLTSGKCSRDKRRLPGSLRLVGRRGRDGA
jgi:hypothetical protein